MSAHPRRDTGRLALISALAIGLAVFMLAACQGASSTPNPTARPAPSRTPAGSTATPLSTPRPTQPEVETVAPPAGLVYLQDGQLYQTGPDGQPVLQPTPTPELDLFPATRFQQASPDGRWSVYVTADGVYAVEMATRDQFLLAPGGEEVASPPVWSADGQQLFFFSTQEAAGDPPASDLFVFDTASQETSRLTFTWDRSECCLQFWPGSSALLLGSWQPGEQVGLSSGYLTLVEPDSGGYQVLAGELTGQPPVFTPQGEAVLFRAGESWYTYRPGGSPQAFDPAAMLPPGQPVLALQAPAYAPDGSRLAFEAVVSDQGLNRVGVVVIDLARGQGRALAPAVQANGGQVESGPAWTADSRYLFFQTVSDAAQESGLWFYDVQTGETTFLAAGPQEALFDPASGRVVYREAGEPGALLLVQAGEWRPARVGLPPEVQLLAWETAAD